MYKTRKMGFGLAMLLGAMVTIPTIAVQAGQTAQGRRQRTRPAAAAPARSTTAAPMAQPMSGSDPCIQALNDVHAAQATVTQLQQLGAEIKARHDQLNAAVVSNDTDAPLKCPACGMMMPTKPTGNLTKAVKYNGKTYYCCKGCDMSATADKE